MLDSGLYESVSLNYLRKATKYGEKINEFEYILVLRRPLKEWIQLIGFFRVFNCD